MKVSNELIKVVIAEAQEIGGLTQYAFIQILYSEALVIR